RLIAGAAAAKQPLATFAIDGEITFRTAADRAAFAEELGVAVTRLVDKYHDGGPDAPAERATAGGGRKHRLVVALQPTLKTAALKAPPTHPSAKEQDND
ncbi:MAG TPA: ArsR family transcriptional regulator, partial [Arthrobacter sp.]|nr:ArsR family transcriptional regulator [Arthrobacter sp.]